MNHVKTGLERIYDRYDLDEDKAAWFLKWENEIIVLASESGMTTHRYHWNLMPLMFGT